VMSRRGCTGLNTSTFAPVRHPMVKSQPPCVLIIADDPVVRQIVARLLVSEGFQAVTAERGQEEFESFARYGDPRRRTGLQREGVGQHALGRLPLPRHTVLWEHKIGPVHERVRGPSGGQPACLRARLQLKAANSLDRRTDLPSQPPPCWRSPTIPPCRFGRLPERLPKESPVDVC
jgi:CheY-like chemotaxis protein